VWGERLAAARAAGRPWLVAEAGDGVIGYTTASAFRPKAAYQPTVETTIYLAPGHAGRGTGRALYGELLDACAAAGFHRAVAGLTLPNPPSAALHERLGFTPVGVFSEVGRKHGAWHDVGWWQLRLDARAQPRRA
jgi:phosphinothricin acetyltransferase